MNQASFEFEFGETLVDHDMTYVCKGTHLDLVLDDADRSIDIDIGAHIYLDPLMSAYACAVVSLSGEMTERRDASAVASDINNNT